MRKFALNYAVKLLELCRQTIHDDFPDYLLSRINIVNSWKCVFNKLLRRVSKPLKIRSITAENLISRYSI